MAAPEDLAVPERQARWQETVADQLPGLLDQLVSSDAYGLGDGRQPPPNEYGVYLFTSTERNEYVGRTGLTERTRLSGGKSYSGFRGPAEGSSHAPPYPWLVGVQASAVLLAEGRATACGLARRQLREPGFHEGLSR